MKKSVCILLLFVSICSCVYGYGTRFRSDYQYRAEKKLTALPRTYEAWVALPAGFEGRAGVIMGGFGCGAASVNFEIADKGIPRLYLDRMNHHTADIRFDKACAATGRPVHVAITYDDRTGVSECYINGGYVQTVKKDFTAYPPVCPLQIGGDVRTGNEQYFKGRIFSAALFEGIRTPMEIKGDMYSLTGAEDGLLCFYDLRTQPDAGCIRDKSGNMDARIYTVLTDEEPAAFDPAYSFALVGDTQIIADVYPDKLHCIYDWILDNREKYRIAYVMGLGDVTNRNSEREWALARREMFRMNGVLPYSVVKGNHCDSTMVNRFFKVPEYTSSYEGSFDGLVENTWRIIEPVKGQKYIIFTLEYGPRDEVMDWAGRIIDSHPDCRAVITTHCYLFHDGTTLDEYDLCPPTVTDGANNGDQMWDKFISKHKSIVLAISGHDPCDDVIMSQAKGEKGNTVSQLLVDPQGLDASGKPYGMVCLLMIGKDGRTAAVRYYSTIENKYGSCASQFEFSLY